jgi:pimeloyl-ACP methyl ester carboxylesterase
MWSAATEKRQRAALRSAFAPETIIPDQFVADLRSRGRRNLVRSNRAIDDYLKARSLANRLADLTTPVELVFGEHDARVAAPGDEFVDIDHVHVSVMPGVGHTPPWETPHQVARLITTPPRAV